MSPCVPVNTDAGVIPAVWMLGSRRSFFIPQYVITLHRTLALMIPMFLDRSAAVTAAQRAIVEEHAASPRQQQ